MQEYNCDQHYMSRDQSHVYEVDVQSSGRLVLDQCGSLWPVVMQLFRRRMTTTNNASGSLEWELVRGFDDERCNDRNRPTHLTWWLEPGQHALVIDHDVSNSTEVAGANYSVKLSAAASPPARSTADHVWTDPYGLGLSTATLRRIDAFFDNATTDTTTIALFDATTATGIPPNRWAGLAYAHSTGKFYGAPRDSQSVLIIDPQTETADTTSISGLPHGTATVTNKWRGFAFAPSVGKLFAAPFNADSVLIIDPATNRTDTLAVSGGAAMAGKWAGIAYAPVSGKLFAAPARETAVLIIDPEARTADATTMVVSGADPSVTLKWFGIVYAPSTEKLYAVPMRAGEILIVDPVANTTDTTAMAGFDTAIYKWSSVAYAPSTGKLYAAPLNTDAVLIVDPATNATDITTMAGLGQGEWKYDSIAFSPSTGLLYAPPRDEASVLLIDPWANTTDGNAMAGLVGSSQWDGIAVSPFSNKLFATPNKHGSVLVISHTASVEACAANNPCARTCRASGCGWDDARVLCLPGRVTTEVATRGNYRIPGNECEPFQLSAACAAEVGDSNFTLVEITRQYVTGQSIVIPGPQADGDCSERGTAFVYPTSDDFSNITFELVVARDDGEEVDAHMFSCTNPATGEATIGNPVTGNYTGTLKAIDGGDPPQEVALTSFQMEVKDHTLAITERCQIEQRRIQDTAAAAEYFIGDGVSIPGFSSSCSPSAAFEGTANPSGVFFRLLLAAAADGGSGQPFDGTKMIDTATGEMLFNATGGAGTNFSATLVAIDGSRNLTVAEWTITPKRHSDLDSTGNGPNGRDCARGARVDSEPFDNRYACNCAGTGYIGENCADAVVVASDGSSDSGAADITVASFGSVLFIIAAAAVAFRVQLYRIKHRPVDMDAMQAEVLEGLGMAQPKDIGDHEFGILLTTGAEIDADATDANHVPEPVAEQLMASVAKIVPRLAAELQRARVTISESHSKQLLLVIPRPHGISMRSDIAERAVAAISRHVKGQNTRDLDQHSHHHHHHHLHGHHQLAIAAVPVTAASLAVPHRTPRELGRTLLTRMTHLGNGAFGEVDLYQVDESRQRGVPPYKVAAKMVKLGSSAGMVALLKEAALMALLQHRNVLALVGVVTAPRDLPALILLEYCEGGELLSTAKDTGLSTTQRLTYAAQVALGMQYVSARNIIHRDLAARNVLLDAMGLCKVADFGMAASLVQKGKTYAAEYIRMQEEVALRWAAPEALQDQKFSAASDVWAYGITVWEIFSAGAEPYASLGIGEIGPFVKGGGRLEPPSPDACPAEVFTVLMAPCWAADPAERPTFGELHDIALQEGGLEDDVARDERQQAQERRQQERTADREHQGPVDRALLGPSVHHIATWLVPAVVAAVPTIKNHASQSSFDSLSYPADATIWHMVHAYVKPASASTVCPRDGTMGCAYVDTLTHEDDVGPATALLSYSWGYRVTEVAAALSDWTIKIDHDPKRAHIWVCSLCLNQHAMSQEAVSPEDLAKEFGDRVVAIGRILPMLEPWDDPGYIKRAWCLFELYTAIRLPQTVTIDIILSPSESKSFHDAIVTDGYSVVDGALEHIHAENATASVQADLDAIRALIQEFAGGFDTLNETVRAHLAHWFENHGGIKVAPGRSILCTTTSPGDGDRAARIYPWLCDSATAGRSSSANDHTVSTDVDDGYLDVAVNANATAGFDGTADADGPAQAGAATQPPPVQTEVLAGFGLVDLDRFGLEV